MVYDNKLETPVKRHKDNEYMLIKNIFIYRFNSAILFYNCNYFREQLFKMISRREDIRSVIIDSAPVNFIDITGLNELTDVIKELREKNISVFFVRTTEHFENKMRTRLRMSGLDPEVFPVNYEEAIGLSKKNQ